MEEFSWEFWQDGRRIAFILGVIVLIVLCLFGVPIFRHLNKKEDDHEQIR